MDDANKKFVESPTSDQFEKALDNQYNQRDNDDSWHGGARWAKEWLINYAKDKVEKQIEFDSNNRWLMELASENLVKSVANLTAENQKLREDNLRLNKSKINSESLFYHDKCRVLELHIAKLREALEKVKEGIESNGVLYKDRDEIRLDFDTYATENVADCTSGVITLDEIKQALASEGECECQEADDLDVYGPYRCEYCKGAESDG